MHRIALNCFWMSSLLKAVTSTVIQLDGTSAFVKTSASWSLMFPPTVSMRCVGHDLSCLWLLEVQTSLPPKLHNSLHCDEPAIMRLLLSCPFLECSWPIDLLLFRIRVKQLLKRCNQHCIWLVFVLYAYVVTIFMINVFPRKALL